MDSDNVFARYYSIGCECCQEQYALWMLSGLPPPPRRKAAAANGDLYKGLMQCQFCFKSKLEGVKLLKCGNCQTEFYCSRECQKQAWPQHKLKCALNCKNKPDGGAQPKPIKDLRAFTAKHRPTFCEAAAAAVGVAQDPARAEEYVLVIYLRPRPDSTRTETSFFAFGTTVVPLSAFPRAQAEEMRGQLRMAHNQNLQMGISGSIGVIQVCSETDVMSMTMVGFMTDGPSLVEGNWKHWLLRRLNEGIVS